MSPVAVASPPPSPASPVVVASPPPPAPPPCKSSVDVETCKDDCDDAFDECKEDGSGNKACKKKKKECKKKCDAATLCPPPPTCEDDIPENFGTYWCSANAKSATFCSSADGERKCKKTCSLCN